MERQHVLIYLILGIVIGAMLFGGSPDPIDPVQALRIKESFNQAFEMMFTNVFVLILLGVMFALAGFALLMQLLKSARG